MLRKHTGALVGSRIFEIFLDGTSLSTEAQTGWNLLMGCVVGWWPRRANAVPSAPLELGQKPNLLQGVPLWPNSLVVVLRVMVYALRCSVPWCLCV